MNAITCSFALPTALARDGEPVCCFRSMMLYNRRVALRCRGNHGQPRAPLLGGGSRRQHLRNVHTGADQFPPLLTPHTLGSQPSAPRPPAPLAGRENRSPAVQLLAMGSS